MSLALARCSSRLTACRPSRRPIAEASAAEEVPSASNPACFSRSAEVPSQGFGMMNPPSRLWRARNRSYSSGCFMRLLRFDALRDDTPGESSIEMRLLVQVGTAPQIQGEECACTCPHRVRLIACMMDHRAWRALPPTAVTLLPRRGTG